MNRKLEDMLQGPLLRRLRTAGVLRFLNDQGTSLRAMIAQKPEVLRGAMRRLAAIAAALPVGAIPTSERGPRRRQELATLVELMNELARAQEEARAEGYTGGPDPQTLRLQASRLRRYRYLRSKSATALNDALDLRQALGGLMAYLLDGITQGVQGWLADPAQQATWSAVELGFSGVLLNKEALQQNLSERRASTSSEKGALEAEIAATEQRLQAEDVATAVSQGLPVTREALEQAAKWHAENKAASEDRRTRR